MDETENKDYLREELQRRARKLDYEKYRAYPRYRRHQLQRRAIALFFAISTIAVAAYFTFFRQFEGLQVPLMLILGAAFAASAPSSTNTFAISIPSGLTRS